MKKFSHLKPIKKVFEQDAQYFQAQPQSLAQLQAQPQGQVQAQMDSEYPRAQAQTMHRQAQPAPRSNPKSGAVKFFSKLLESREMAQVYHWTVKGDMGSHAAHTALEEYYNEVIGLLDQMVEVYQGQYDVIEGYDIINTTETKSKERIEYFKEIAEFIKENRFQHLSKDDSHLQNIVDEVLASVYRLLYKLRFNR